MEISQYIWDSEDLCVKCRDQRASYEFKRRNKTLRCVDYEKNKWEKEGLTEFCPPYVGFSNNPSKFGKGAIFFILESIGGARPWKTRKDGLEATIEDLKGYYLKKGLTTFHQKCIREILREFNDHPYVVSDMVKCFIVKKNERNFIDAMNSCVDHFLSKQLKAVKPKIIVLFGTHYSINGLMRLVEDCQRPRLEELRRAKNRHGKVLNSLKMSMGYTTTLLFSRFPTQWQADNWIRYGGSKIIINEIKKLISGSKWL